MPINRMTQRSQTNRTFALFVCALCFAFSDLSAAAAEPVQFTVLSYNTHGLPSWIARDQPAKRFPQIAKLAVGYDITLFQENFVDSDFDLLTQGSPGRFLARGNGSRAGWLSLLSTFCGSCGSGLTTAIDPNFKVELLDRKAYGSCSGWIGDANDCWASKGYLAVRVALPNGDSIDIYDLHLDAGPSHADHKVRTAQLEVLRAEVNRLSSNRALIIAGDFNLDSRTPRDRILLDSFSSDLQLAHSGAGGSAVVWPEQIDHIYYRSNESTKLKVITAGEAKEFRTPEQMPLSDHPAVFTKFEAN